MIFENTSFDKSYIIKPEPFQDHRGFFNRVYCKNELSEINFKKPILQINHSMTRKKGSIRGMHYQKPPYTETKIVKCIKGSIFDVIIDLRKNSSTFLKWFGTELSSENMCMLIVPDGFAHGFQTLEVDCELLYLHTELYSPDYEAGLHYNDHLISVSWPLKISDVSEKDNAHNKLDSNFMGLLI